MAIFVKAPTQQQPNPTLASSVVVVVVDMKMTVQIIAHKLNGSLKEPQMNIYRPNINVM